MEIIVGCWLVAWPVGGRNIPSGACVSGTTAPVEGSVTVALLVKAPRMGKVASIFVCSAKKIDTTFVSRSADKLVG